MKGFALLFVLTLGLPVAAATLTARIELPDGSGAPFAQITMGQTVFVADAQGRVELPAEGKAQVSWLELHEEMKTAKVMRFSHDLIYGPPYDKADWILSRSDKWIFGPEVIAYTASDSGQATLNLQVDDVLVRYIVVYKECKQWHYLRTLLRTPVNTGWMGYGLSLAGVHNDHSYCVRYDGAWNTFQEITPRSNLGFNLSLGEEYEVVMVAQEARISAYIRHIEADGYYQLFAIEDDSPGALYSGYLSFINSYTVMEMRELAVFEL